MGGYGPPSTTFSRALRIIGDRLLAQFGGRIEVKYVWNVMDLGHRSEDLWTLVEDGSLTLAYLSTSGLSGRVPALGIADLPFLFKDETSARAAIDGALGAFLAEKIEANLNCRVFGFFENGFRQVSNALRPIRLPSDFGGMSIRTLNSRIQGRSFELLGAVPKFIALDRLIGALQRGELDGQENPFANTVTYGAHKHQHFHTLTNHFYVSRAVFAHRPSVEAWPDDLRAAMRTAVQEATLLQRDFAFDEEVRARAAIEDYGCEVVELDDAGRQAFQAAVKPVYREALEQFGDDLQRALGRENVPSA